MSEKLKQLVKELKEAGLEGVSVKKIGALDEKTRKLLEEYSKQFEEALKKAKESLTTPLINRFGQCPNCESKEYFPLFGGSCGRLCAKCKKPYDCLSLSEYLKRLRKGR